jgi:signal transduction histidine kinase
MENHRNTFQAIEPNGSAWDVHAYHRRVFGLLVVYRWLCLIPPLIFLGGNASDSSWPLLSFLAAIGSNVLITLFPAQLNELLRRWPFWLTLDLAFVAVLIALSGEWRSPYYLFSLSPLLAAAFFFGMRRALLAATTLTLLFAAALFLSNQPLDWTPIISQWVGYFVIAGVFGYQPVLLTRLHTARDDLERAHRDLALIHDLTMSLQSAPDVSEVEERVLSAVTNDLGFARAVVALVDQDENVITSWMGKARDGMALFAADPSHTARLALSPQGGPIAEALLERRKLLWAHSVETPHAQLNTQLGRRPYHLFPMILREHPVGILLVEASADHTPERLRSLEAIASQAAVAVGTTMLCIDRARRLAVQDERLRIAREIHDTASQSLFGLVFSLDACAKLLPTQAEQVKHELDELRQLAESTRSQLRHTILDLWPHELTAQQFVADLKKYMGESCRMETLQLQFNVCNDFSRLPPRLRRGLYRIAQEALTNVAHHAAASEVQLCIALDVQQVDLSIQDDGRGFDPAHVLDAKINPERFGLRGMIDRAQALGGTCEILSQPHAGTTILVSIPAPILPNSPM